MVDLAVRFAAPPEYSTAHQVALWMIPSGVFTGIYYWGASLLHLTKRTPAIGHVTALAAVLSLALNYLLVPRYGWLGAAIATNASMLVAALLVVLLGLRAHPLKLDRPVLFAAAATTAFLYAAACFVSSTPLLRPLVLTLGVLVAAAIAHRAGLRLARPWTLLDKRSPPPPSLS